WRELLFLVRLEAEAPAVRIDASSRFGYFMPRTAARGASGPRGRGLSVSTRRRAGGDPEAEKALQPGPGGSHRAGGWLADRPRASESFGIRNRDEQQHQSDNYTHSRQATSRHSKHGQTLQKRDTIKPPLAQAPANSGNRKSVNKLQSRQ